MPSRATTIKNINGSGKLAYAAFSLANEVRSSIPGVTLVTAVAVTAYLTAPFLLRYSIFSTYLSFKDFILATVFGIAIGNTIGVGTVFRPGLRFSTLLTKVGIVVMGAKYSFSGLTQVGGLAIVLISVFMFSSAIVIMWVSQKMRIPAPLSACLAAGLSICGVSGTIAIAPVVGARNKDIAYAIAVVLMFGLLSLIVFPFIGNLYGLSDAQFGAFCGVGIVNSAHVLAAGFGYSEGAGLVAGIYDIGRLFLLPFVVLLLVVMICGNQRYENSTGGMAPNKWQLIRDRFPLFILGFFTLVIFNSMGMFNASEIHQIKVFMNWSFLLAFASIGLTTRLSDLKSAGWSGFGVGFLVAGIKALLALFAVQLFIE